MPKFLKIEFSFCVFAVAFLLLVPLKLAIAWLLAVSVHELCHYIALQIYGTHIYTIRLRGFGVFMETEPLSGNQELVCALAGPVGGLCTLLLGKWMPCTAICSFILSGYNLIPIYPLDGGRALKCIMGKFFSNKIAEKITFFVADLLLALLGLCAIWMTWKYNAGILPLLFVLLLFARNHREKFLANRGDK